MKYLIFSDVHGSLDDINQVLKCYKLLQCDKLICLGDVLYHGPRNDLPPSYNPKEVVKILKDEDIQYCQGNCDSEVDAMVLDIKYKKRFHIKRMLFTHGHHLKFRNYIFWKVVFYGHTHIRDFRKIKNTYYINPGSIALPKKDEKSFIVLENNEVKFYDLNGNIIFEKSI